MKDLKKGHELLTAKLYDALSASKAKGRPVLTSFLSVPEQQLAETLLSNKTELSFYGGYEGADRRQAIVGGDEASSDIVCLSSPLHDELSHPKVLGALMHLGIERDQIGDIRIEDGTLYIFCRKSLAGFICSELVRAGRAALHLHEEEKPALSASQVETVEVVCSSVRLDAVVAALAHVSRSAASEKLRTGEVKVNDVVVASNGNLCENDFVSVRRAGRFRFRGVKSGTKKGRLVLTFEKSI